MIQYVQHERLAYSYQMQVDGFLTYVGSGYNALFSDNVIEAMILKRLRTSDS